MEVTEEVGPTAKSYETGGHRCPDIVGVLPVSGSGGDTIRIRYLGGVSMNWEDAGWI